MKLFQPKTIYYRDLLAACRQELLALGYATDSLVMTGAREFLARMEVAGKMRLSEVSKADIKNHYAYLNTRTSHRGEQLSLHTLPGYVFDLRLLLDYAERHGLVQSNPMTGLKFRRPKGGRKLVCTREEINALFAACTDQRQRAVLHLLYGCGLRRMEVGKLDLADVDFLAALLYVRQGKGKRRRVVPLNDTTKIDLADYVKHNRPIWLQGKEQAAFLLNNRGARMSGGTMYRHFKELVEAAGISDRISPHIMRHSIATHLLEGGMSVEKVRDFLGHQYLETTQLYTHVKTEKL